MRLSIRDPKSAIRNLRTSDYIRLHRTGASTVISTVCLSPPATYTVTTIQEIQISIPAARPRVYVSANARFFLQLIALLLVLFSLLRAGLIWRNWTPGLATPGQLFMAFVIGVRFDLAVACFLALPVVVACFVPWTAPWRGPRTRRAFVWVVSSVVSILAFTLICEFEFFREFQSRFNQLAIRYWEHPTIVGGMVWYNYPVVRYVLAWLALATVIFFIVRAIARRTYAFESTGLPHDLWVEAAGAFVIVCTITIGARGGLQSEPLRWGDAFKGKSEFANQMSLNGLYSLANALRDMLKRDGISSGWAGQTPLTEARQTVREMILAPGERLTDPVHRTVLRTGDGGAGVLLKPVGGKPINVVVVMMESFSARFVGSCGASPSFTPAFDALANDGLLFDRCFSAGSHTHQGIFATQLGFPNLPGYETLMESGVSNQHFLSLGEIFQSLRYQTFFLYNGDFAWDNMLGFFRQQGIESFIGGAEMVADAKYHDPVWGVSDGDLFDRANREFESASKKGPFFAAIMTLSNHAPYMVPPVPGAQPITDQGEYSKRLEAMRYADYAVGKFIDDAKKLDYFKNTLFVFVGDHGFHVPPILTEVQLLYHHVPLLFYAPALLDRHGVDHRVAGQTNIVPSIVGLLGLNESPHASWARSLFNDHFPDPNFAVFKMSGGGHAVAMAQDDHLLVLGSITGKPLLMTYDIGRNPTIAPLNDPALEKSMETRLRAYIQSALDDLLHQHAGPVGGDKD